MRKITFYYLFDTLRKYALTLFPQPPQVWIRSQRETWDSGCTVNMKSWIITPLRIYFLRRKRYQVRSNTLNSKHTPSPLSLREKPSLHLDLSCRSTHPLPVYDQTQHPHTQKTTSVRLGAEICQGRLGKQRDGSKFVPDFKYRNNERLLKPAKMNHFFLTL